MNNDRFELGENNKNILPDAHYQLEGLSQKKLDIAERKFVMLNGAVYTCEVL